MSRWTCAVALALTLACAPGPGQTSTTAVSAPPPDAAQAPPEQPTAPAPTEPATTTAEQPPPATPPATTPSAPPTTAPAPAVTAPPAAPTTTPAPPATPPPAAPHAWPGTRIFGDPWTEVNQVVALAGGGLLVAGSQFLVDDTGLGMRHGAIAWLDATGAIVRTRVSPDADDVFGLATSPAGAVAVAGYAQGDGGFILALHEDGTVAWRVSLGEAAAVYGVAFAPDGAVVACGFAPDGSWIGRWSPDGRPLWRQVFDASAGADASGFGLGVALSPSGEIAAAGGTGPIAVARLGPDGEQRWFRTVDGGAPSHGGGVAVDGTGAVLVAGAKPGSTTGDDAFVARLDASGALAWTRIVATPAHDAANAVAVDDAGNAVVVGSRGQGAGTGDSFATRYAPDGTAAWTADLDQPGNDLAAGVALDAAGNAFVVGSFEAGNFGFHRNGYLAKVSREGTVE